MPNEQEPQFELLMRDRAGRWWALDVEEWTTYQPPDGGHWPDGKPGPTGRPRSFKLSESARSTESKAAELPDGWMRLVASGPVRRVDDAGKSSAGGNAPS